MLLNLLFSLKKVTEKVNDSEGLLWIEQLFHWFIPNWFVINDYSIWLYGIWLIESLIDEFIPMVIQGSLKQ